MSAGNSRPSKDQFLCSICLDVFTDPVTTSCGHNFCKNCINEHWDVNPRRCPMCKKGFKTKPQLQVNTLLSEMVAQFRHGAQQKASGSSSEHQAAKPGEVPCDICTGTKLKALKSCLVCVTSYCETHLEPHLTALSLKRHQLMEPVENLEELLCKKHDKPLELFCRTDQTCVCSICSILGHKSHELVPLMEEYEGKKAELGKTEAGIQQMIQKRRLKVQELKESVKMSKDAADTEKEDGIQVFTALMESIQRGLGELMEEIEAKQRTTAKQAEDFISDLEEEISELMKRSSEMKQLLSSAPHLHLLQRFLSLKAAPPTKDWTEVRIHPPSYEGMVAKAVAQLEKEMKTLFESNRRWKYAVDVTLDPDTANPHLVLSDDGKQVKHQDGKKKLPDNPERFSQCPSVLGKQSFSSGRFYFEVQVQGKTDWTLGVARESVNRKGMITLSPQFGFWTLCLTEENLYKVNAGPSVRLHLQSHPKKVGVFVDYERGLVSFYNAETLIYSFTGCCFTDKLRPYFSPHPNYFGINSAPLIICPVHFCLMNSPEPVKENCIKPPTL